jgi:hypothetical protein
MTSGNDRPACIRNRPPHPLRGQLSPALGMNRGEPLGARERRGTAPTSPVRPSGPRVRPLRNGRRSARTTGRGASRSRPGAGADGGRARAPTTATRSRSAGWCPAWRWTAGGRPGSRTRPSSAAGRTSWGRRSPTTARRCRSATASWCSRRSPRRGPLSCARCNASYWSVSRARWVRTSSAGSASWRRRGRAGGTVPATCGGVGHVTPTADLRARRIEGIRAAGAHSAPRDCAGACS